MVSAKNVLALIPSIWLSLSCQASNEQRFTQANSARWQEVFYDPCTEDWTRQWFLDGEIGKVVNSAQGMSLTAGSEFKNDAHHMVLWTKKEFSGDIKIDYEYTRLDNETNCVNILYLQASGSGEGPYHQDITKWNELRKIPSMKTYFDHMHTYHISYAAFPNSKRADPYLRARRYLPEGRGLGGTNLKPEYVPKGFFSPGVPHQISVIKRDQTLYMKVENEEQTAFYSMENTDFPGISSGRIGLRHMYTRSARYKNFRVSTAQ